MEIRTIIFRGKRIDNGEWVYGYFVSEGEESYIFEQEEVDKGIDLGGYLDCCQMSEVIPETVGQYTGITDKNGRKIFEGDIVGCFLNTQIFEIEYCEERCGYFLDDIMLSGDAPLSIECLGNMRNTVEVIGTIHDHPELLKGGEQ